MLKIPGVIITVKSIFIPALSLALFALPALADRPELSGELEITQSVTTVGGYGAVEANVSELFNSLLSQARSSLPESGTAHLAELGENDLQFMNALYLYCTVNQGTCALVLDSLLELEVVKSRLRGKADCPTLLRFWKLWLKNDMERRHEFLGKTGFLNDYQKFNREQRGRYVRCQPTVAEQIQSNESNIEFFKKRYAQDGAPLKTLSQMSALLTGLKAKGVNIFKAVDMKYESSAQPSGSSGNTKKPESKIKKGAVKKTL